MLSAPATEDTEFELESKFDAPLQDGGLEPAVAVAEADSENEIGVLSGAWAGGLLTDSNSLGKAAAAVDFCETAESLLNENGSAKGPEVVAAAASLFFSVSHRGRLGAVLLLLDLDAGKTSVEGSLPVVNDPVDELNSFNV